MKIVADQNILYVREYFGDLGELVLMPAEQIQEEAVVDADALLIRTICKVGKKMMQGSKLRFIGTASIGTDHIDLESARELGIEVVSAAGCNAVAVAEYVISAWLILAERFGVDFRKQVLGIVGLGHTGSALLALAQKLGVKCLISDPPRFEQGSLPSSLPIEELMPQADVISFHVPLSKKGPHETYHLLDEQLLRLLKPSAILINTSRGQVVDEAALIKRRSYFKGLALDVFENEPTPNPEIVNLADIATPHVAGYSIEGKRAATQLVFEGLRSAFKFDKKAQDPFERLPRPTYPIHPGYSKITEVLGQVNPILQDDQYLRKIMTDKKMTNGFAPFRNSYDFKREFQSILLKADPGVDQALLKILNDLNFQLV